MKAKRETVSNPSSQPAKPPSFPSNPDGKEAIANNPRVVESSRKETEPMGRYLNPDDDSFASCKRFSLYVDKSMLIKETNACFGIDEAKFMCVTRPRRFGKTMALKMLSAYYSKKNDSRELFKDLKISKDPSFEEHLNKHNVLWVDMTGIYTDAADKSDFVSELRQELIDALKEAFPNVITEKEDTARKAFAKVREETGERFVFLIDEWDVIYREQSHNRKVCDDYTEFLRSLFKSSDASKCFDLVYMTGILPIRRYNTQSALNMFREYNVLKPRGLASLFGFTEDEVKELCKKHNAGFPEIKDWYDGYRLGGIEIYNPKSVVEAIRDGECGGHWVATSSVEAVTDYMNYDHGVLKGEIIRMLAGERVELNPSKFRNNLTQVDSKDAALTVLAHLGYLAFIPGPNDDRGVCYIPNKEIAKEFEFAVEALGWEDIYDPISNSPRLLKATVNGDVEAISRAFDRNHRELAAPFTKNDEGVLALITIVSYYRAREDYWVRKEETSMNGRSDVSFFPKKPGRKPIIVELKMGKSPDEAIAQIKRKRYWEAWEGYRGEVLLIGISYEEDTLKHSSKAEWIDVG